MKLNRRQFVTGVTAALVACGITSVQRRYLKRRVPPELLRPDVLIRFLDRQSIVQLGTLYRHKVEAERGTGQLMDLLMAGMANVASRDSAAWRTAIEARSRDDFAGGHIVELDGWVLSRTEARQCALLASLSA